MAEDPYLSLVIPAYNEQENVPTLLERVAAALAQAGRPFEVIIVDDGSTDDTPRLLAEAMTRYPWLRVLRMARNGGQSAAFEAGFGPPPRAGPAPHHAPPPKKPRGDPPPP